MATEFARKMRSVELELTVPFFPPGGRILEVGAGDGWQANKLRNLGFDVTAIDVRRAKRILEPYFEVHEYDGRNLPFPSDSFDIIYSSNVLEHLTDFDYLQSEMARVLRPEGLAVHCVPSAVWRFWTTVGHPIYVARVGFQVLRTVLPCTGTKPAGSTARTPSEHVSRRRLLRSLLPSRHGEHCGILSEHWQFSDRAWKRRIKGANWHIEAAVPTQLFYTGNELLGLRLGVVHRRRLASLLGSSTLLYATRPAMSRTK